MAPITTRPRRTRTIALEARHMRHDRKPAIVSAHVPSDAPVVKPTITVRATWAGAHLFDTGRPDGPTARFDGSAKVGQNPVDALVSSLATCVGIDVVDILAKRRTPASSLVVDAHAERRATHPRRLERVTMTFRVEGEGVEQSHTERAVELALANYCSVAASLAPDIVIETRVEINAAAGRATPLESTPSSPSANTHNPAP